MEIAYPKRGRQFCVGRVGEVGLGQRVRGCGLAPSRSVSYLPSTNFSMTSVTAPALLSAWQT